MTDLPDPIGPPVDTSIPYVPPPGTRPPHVAPPRPPHVAPPCPPHPTLPIAAASGAVVVLVASLLASKLALDALVPFDWPIPVYVALLAVVGYGPPLVWCWYVSRRWGSGRVASDVGLTPRWSDLGWGPLVWLTAVGCQVAIGALVLVLDIPSASNTEGIVELRADRTYVISIVVAAVVAAPVVEEVVFRGVVLRGLLSRLPVVVAIGVQAVLFGVAHFDPVFGLGNIGLILVLSAVGAAFGGAAYLLRRIGPTVVAHAILNGVVLTIVLTGVADDLRDEARVGSAVEQRAVVDQADVADPHRSRDPG